MVRRLLLGWSANFIIPTDRAKCICAAFGTVVHEEPEFEPDA